MNDAEINAMDEAYRALEDLDEWAKVRVMRYLIARFGLGDRLRNTV